MKQTRNRSRYAKDELAERAAALALKLGVSLTLHSDGSVTIRGKLLDSAANDAAASGAKGEDDAEGYETWKQENGAARRQ